MAADDKARCEKDKPVEKPKKKAKAAEEEEVSTDEEKATPKKAPTKRSGYMYFCKHNRENVKKENPGMSAQEVARIMAGLWKELSDEEQKNWNVSANTK